MRALMTGIISPTSERSLIFASPALTSNYLAKNRHPGLSPVFFRFKLLETKLESTLKSSLEIKEEKIAALEARLQESSNLNQQLRQELKTVSSTHILSVILLNTGIYSVLDSFSPKHWPPKAKTHKPPPKNKMSQNPSLALKKARKHRGLHKTDALFIHPLLSLVYLFMKLQEAAREVEWRGGCVLSFREALVF